MIKNWCYQFYYSLRQWILNGFICRCSISNIPLPDAPTLMTSWAVCMYGFVSSACIMIQNCSDFLGYFFCITFVIMYYLTIEILNSIYSAICKMPFSTKTLAIFQFFPLYSFTKRRRLVPMRFVTLFTHSSLQTKTVAPYGRSLSIVE